MAKLKTKLTVRIGLVDAVFAIILTLLLNLLGYTIYDVVVKNEFIASGDSQFFLAGDVIGFASACFLLNCFDALFRKAKDNAGIVEISSARHSELTKLSTKAEDLEDDLSGLEMEHKALEKQLDEQLLANASLRKALYPPTNIEDKTTDFSQYKEAETL